MANLRWEDIDWTGWKAQQLATLLFVVRDGHVLLIHKKRGLGAGKINGPGGRIDDGETFLQAAIREVQEEVRVTPIAIEPCGALFFQFVDGLSIYVEVFRANDCEGEPQETDEAQPFWAPIDNIPFEKMWADDRHWIPLMLARKKFHGRFLFDEDKMLGHEIKILEQENKATRL
jgi:8-oxo-dGTP diphosphatase